VLLHVVAWEDERMVPRSVPSFSPSGQPVLGHDSTMVCAGAPAKGVRLRIPGGGHPWRWRWLPAVPHPGYDWVSPDDRWRTRPADPIDQGGLMMGLDGHGGGPRLTASQPTAGAI
jgi:hypothetical protein